MGNWITVGMVGSANKEDAKRMIEWLTFSRETYSSVAYEKLGVYYLQISSSVYGLNKWIKEDGIINVTGNVFERDCEVDELYEEVKALCNEFKSLELTVHIGGDYESTKVVATIVGNSESVELLEPQIEELNEISMNATMERLGDALGIKFKQKERLYCI